MPGSRSRQGPRSSTAEAAAASDIASTTIQPCRNAVSSPAAAPTAYQGTVPLTSVNVPDDDSLRRLVDDLRRASARFAELWQARAVAVRTAERKRIDHPEVGPLTLDCDVFTVQGSDLRVIAYTAEPGSDDAEKLALLRVIGLQAMSG